MSLKAHYDWRRFWSRREANINLSDRGFLVDPDADYGSALNPDVVPFDRIATFPCLVLLGEPGIGKSTALQKERTQVVTPDVEWVDLREYGSDASLRRDLFGSPRIKEWRGGESHLHLFLDSLDECIIRIDNLSALLAGELRKLPVERLSIRLACRTAEWPNGLETALIELWGEAGVGVFELAPLRRTDVATAADAEGLNSEEFVREVIDREIVPFAIKPVTLAFLLNLHNRGALPSSRSELYTEGCRLLCEETNDDARLLGKLSDRQRLAVASRIAAMTVFCSRAAIWTGADIGNTPQTDIRLDDLSDGTEPTKGASVAVDADGLRETLDTGLFTSRGPNRIGWAHQTYAEFLAAQFLINHGLSTEQMLAIIALPNAKIVPQLHETAGWLATLVPAVFRRLIELDPEVLFGSDIATASKNDRAELVSTLLRLHEQEKLFDLELGRRWFYRKLAHADISNQLRPYITDRTRGLMVRRIAIDIAEACELKTLMAELAHAALDRDENTAIRVRAAYTISRIGNDETKALLKPLALEQAGDDPDDELKGCGLRCTWPGVLTPTELLAALTPPKNFNLIGSYSYFLHSDIAEHFGLGDLPLALGWVETNAASIAGVHLLADVAEKICVKGLDHMENPAVRDVLPGAIKGWLQDEGHVGYRGSSVLRPKLEDVALRRSLVRELFAVLSFPKDQFFLIYPGELIDRTDTIWLIEELNQNKAEDLQRMLSMLIRRMADYRDPQIFEAVVLASRQNRFLAEELRPLLEPIPLDSELATELKNEYIANLTRAVRANPVLEPPPQQRIASLLDRFETGDVDAFWRLQREMTLEPDSTHYREELEPDLRVLPGWKQADLETRGRIIEAAKRYLEVGDPKTDEWLGSNTITYMALAGYWSLLLLLAEAPEFLGTLPITIWSRWAPLTLAYPYFGTRENSHKRVLEMAYAAAPDSILNTFETLLSTDRFSAHSLLAKVTPLWDDRISRLLLEHATAPNEKLDHVGVILRELLQHRVAGAVEMAVGRITDARVNWRIERWPVPGLRRLKDFVESKWAAIAGKWVSQDQDKPQESMRQDSQLRSEDQLAVAAACELLSANEAWEPVWSAISANPKFGLWVFERLTDIEGHYGGVLKGFTEVQLGDVFIWLQRNVPEGHGLGSGAVSRDQQLQRLRDGVMRQLTGRGTADACSEIRRVMKKFPRLEALKWQLAEAEAEERKRSWMPMEPKQLIEFVKAAERPVDTTRWWERLQVWSLRHWILGPIIVAFGSLIFLTDAVDSSRKALTFIYSVLEPARATRIPGGTGWVLLGKYRVRERAWVNGTVFETVRTAGDALPVIGDEIRLTSTRDVIILGYARSGTSRRLEAPGGNSIQRDGDFTGTTLPIGTVLQILDVKEAPGGDGVDIWARISMVESGKGVTK